LADYLNAVLSAARNRHSNVYTTFTREISTTNSAKYKCAIDP
jgi:hypothetical protein